MVKRQEPTLPQIKLWVKPQRKSYLICIWLTIQVKEKPWPELRLAELLVKPPTPIKKLLTKAIQSRCLWLRLAPNWVTSINRALIITTSQSIRVWAMILLPKNISCSMVLTWITVSSSISRVPTTARVKPSSKVRVLYNNYSFRIE